MAIHISAILLLVISVFTPYVYSFCTLGPILSQKTKLGNAEKYCEYNDLKLLIGSSFKLASPQCTDCTCTASGLRCCGFGFASGTIGQVGECVPSSDGCELVFVKKTNASELCGPNTINKNKNKKNKNKTKLPVND